MVTVLPGTDKFPLQKIGKMAGICWNSPVEDPDKNLKRAVSCIESGHGRVLEFVDIELCIEGYSARVIREWYTHISGGPTRLQESTRYVNCDKFEYVIPPKLNDLQRECYIAVMETIRSSYARLVQDGVTKEDAANILPLGMNTKIVDKRNLRNFMSMAEQRLCTRAYWEYKNLMNDILKALRGYSAEWTYIVDNFIKCKCEVKGFCTEEKCCGIKPKKEKENAAEV